MESNSGEKDNQVHEEREAAKRSRGWQNQRTGLEEEIDAERKFICRPKESVGVSC